MNICTKFIQVQWRSEVDSVIEFCLPYDCILGYAKWKQFMLNYPKETVLAVYDCMESVNDFFQS